MTSPVGPASAWEHVESEGSVVLHAWGASHAEAFARAAEALFALIVPPGDVASEETREARAQAATPSGLLASWLTECLYVHEIEGFAVARVDVDAYHAGLVHGVLHGEPVDPARHRVRPVGPARGESGDVRQADGRVDVRIAIVV